MYNRTFRHSCTEIERSVDPPQQSSQAQRKTNQPHVYKQNEEARDWRTTTRNQRSTTNTQSASTPAQHGLPKPKYMWGNRVCMLRWWVSIASVSSTSYCLGKLPWLREFGLYPRLEWANKASVLTTFASVERAPRSTSFFDRERGISRFLSKIIKKID